MNTYHINNKNFIFYHGKDIRVTVFPKTGTTFMDTMTRAYHFPKVGGDVPFEDDVNKDIIKHYISVRAPFARFVSGFCTLYYRSHHNNKTPKYQDLYTTIQNLPLDQAFYECYNKLDNDWSFDAHTSNCLDQLPQQQANTMYIDYTDIGLLMEKAGYLPSYENIPVEQYRNSNPISDKEYLLNLIVNDKEVHKNVHKYLSADIELYQELPITKIIA